jgi:hypothetical protein
MSLGSDTFVINGQRFSQPTGAQYSPTQYGPQTTGIPQVSPTQPPFIGAANGGASSLGGMEGVGGYGTSGNNSLVTATAANNPHNLKVSPAWPAVICLVVGLLLLKAVHWRKTTLEGFDERGNVGEARESAAESV